MTRVETQGSWWLLDDTRYMRMPKQEKPRENGWGGPNTGALQDFIWHPMDSWLIEPRGRLLITLPGDDRRISAPLTVAEMHRQGLWEEP